MKMKKILQHIKQYQKRYLIGVLVSAVLGGAMAYGFDGLGGLLTGDLTRGRQTTVLEITTPNGGEFFETGQTMNIEWRVRSASESRLSPKRVSTTTRINTISTSSFTQNTRVISVNSKVDLPSSDPSRESKYHISLIPERTNSNPNRRTQVIARNVTGNAYQWVIPGGVEGDFRIRLVRTGSNNKDFSDAFFTIGAASPGHSGSAGSPQGRGDSGSSANSEEEEDAGATNTTVTAQPEDEAASGYTTTTATAHLESDEKKDGTVIFDVQPNEYLLRSNAQFTMTNTDTNRVTTVGIGSFTGHYLYGHYTVTFDDVGGLETPDDVSFFLNSSSPTVTVVGHYQALSKPVYLWSQ
ncbi:hypothetical protein KAR91_71685 [Candidatus Pacearchaeota archaeon]|nr:hypothetical protein [Candidatus Pacearchaeota archaeon]